MIRRFDSDRAYHPLSGFSARSSVVERVLRKDEATGSSPVGYTAMTIPDQPDGLSCPDWVETVSGDVKSNGNLHIWSSESAGAVMTSDTYVRPE